MQRTKLPWPEYRDEANKLFKQGIKPAQIKEQLGDPHWEGKSWHIKSNGKGGIARQLLDNRRGIRTKANKVRSLRAVSKGISEDAHFRNQLRIAKSQSNSTLHQHVSQFPTIVEHDVALQAGGSNSFTSLSDPLFKQFKDDAESKIYSKVGKENVIVDIDDVSGGVRVIPTSHHNKHQPTSKQPGVTFEPGQDIDLAKVEAILEKSRSKSKSKPTQKTKPKRQSTNAVVESNTRTPLSISGVPVPQIGTLQGGGYRIELDPFSGASIMLP